MRNARLIEAQAEVKIAGRNINNLRYADDTTLMTESEEKLKSLLMKVKEEKHSASSASVVEYRLRLLCDVEWFALEMSQDHFVIFEMCSRYRIFSFYLVHVSKQLCYPAFPHSIFKFTLWKNLAFTL